jgi:hypothetical protein
MKLYEITLTLEKLWDDLQGKIAALEEKNLTVEDYKREEDALYLEHEKALLSMEGTHTNKCLDVAAYIKNLSAEEQAVTNEEVKLKLRRKRLEKNVDFYKAYLRNHMEPGYNVKDSRVVISWRKSSAVVVYCKPEDLPLEYQRRTIFIEPKRDAIKDGLLAGDETLKDKAVVEERQNIIIK